MGVMAIGSILGRAFNKSGFLPGVNHANPPKICEIGRLSDAVSILPRNDGVNPRTIWRGDRRQIAQRGIQAILHTERMLFRVRRENSEEGL